MLLIRYFVLTDAKVQTNFEISKQKNKEKFVFLLKNFVFVLFIY